MPADETVNTAAQEYYCRLTDAGAALEAAAHAAAKPVVLTHVAVGDGNGEVPAPAASATALVNEVYRRQIDGRERDKEDPNIAWLHIIIPADVGGFWIREFGIYAAPLEEGGEPVLYAYGNHAPYYKQQTAQGQATTHELSIPIILSGTAEVEISVKDAGYASQLAFEDLRDTVKNDRKRLWENDGEGPKVLDAVLPLATQEAPGVVQPDGATVTVDEDGILSALGGNLLLNSKMLITESGEWEAPVSGWFHVRLQDGGDGGYIVNRTDARGFYGGSSGKTDEYFLYFNKGDVVPVIIGAGGPSLISSTPSQFAAVKGGATSFGDYVCRYNNEFFGDVYRGVPLTGTASLCDAAGAGPGGRSPYSPGVEEPDGFKYYGSGGSAYLSVVGGELFVSGGGAGCVEIRYQDPAKASGPAPALFSARRMTVRAAATPATVNLYDPETGQGSAWREEDAEAKLAEGMITEAAWLEICQAKAAEDYTEWLACPETEAERFAMLRGARDARLAATDHLVAPDYPLNEEQKALVTAYRQALRDLPAQAGAPWDGGGEATPWPDAPA